MFILRNKYDMETVFPVNDIFTRWQYYHIENIAYLINYFNTLSRKSIKGK